MHMIHISCCPIWTQQEGGSLIAPMVLAHPLNPIDSRSRNRRWNLWVGRCASSWWSLFPSRSCVLIYIYIHLYVCILYTSSVIKLIYTYNRSVVHYWWSCTPSHSIRLFFGGSVWFLGWMPLFFVFFGLPIVSCSMINSLILGCLWPLVFVLNNILILGIWHSTISHLPWCFCPWTSFQNIRFNTVPSTPLCHIYLLNLDNLQGSFRLCNWLSLWRLVPWINHLPPACLSTFWKSTLKQPLGCRSDIMDSISSFFFWHMQLYMSWYIRSFFGFTFLNILYFFQVLLY